MSRTLEQRARFDLVRYANCWEDAALLVEALAPAPGKRLLSIASAGDNSFSLLAAGGEVVAADLSPAQLALVELKVAAIRHLPYAEAVAFLGVGGGDRERQQTYAALAAGLSAEARAFWEAHPEAVAGGVIHHGRFEDYFRLFRRRVLPLVHRRRTIEALLAPRDAAARLAFYERRWNNLRWRAAFRLFFSRFAMGRLGRDPEFFRYVEGSVAERILARARHALTVLPTHDNPYLTYILRGDFGPALPHYLHPEVFPRVRDGLDRLTLVRAPVEEVAESHRGGGFDGFNLSDIFEYMDPGAAAGVYRRLLAVARPGARFAYWNMLVPRRHPADCAGRVRALDAEASRLFARDRAFFYSAFILEVVV